MTVITKGAPPATPYEAELLAKAAQLLPPIVRDIVAGYAENVNIERAALEVCAVDRAGKARAKQLALLGWAAQAASNRKGDPDGPAKAAQVVRMLTDFRVQTLQVLQGAQAGLVDGSHPPWLE